jgi:hypothetical protein
MRQVWAAAIPVLMMSAPAQRKVVILQRVLFMSIPSV